MLLSNRNKKQPMNLARSGAPILGASLAAILATACVGTIAPTQLGSQPGADAEARRPRFAGVTTTLAPDGSTTVVSLDGATTTPPPPPPATDSSSTTTTPPPTTTTPPPPSPPTS